MSLTQITSDVANIAELSAALIVDATPGGIRAYINTLGVTPTTAPNRPAGANDSTIANTAYVFTAVASKADNNSPTLTGTPRTPTGATLSPSDTQIANSAFVYNAVNGKAPLNSPTFTGTPRIAIIPAANAPGDYIPTTDWVRNITNLKADKNNAVLTGIPTAPDVGGSGSSRIATVDYVTTTLTGRAPTNSPTFTGTPTFSGTVDTGNPSMLATVGYVIGKIYDRAPKDSPAFTGNATAPNLPPVSPGTSAIDFDNSNKIATTSFVQNITNLKAYKNDTILTGTPNAPTALSGSNTTQIATTAFVHNAVQSVPGFPSGTKLLFAQATAPTGWTQIVSSIATGRMLHVVNNGSGGTFGGTDDPLLNNTVPSHSHLSGSLYNIAAGNHTHANGIYTNVFRPPYVGSLTGNDSVLSGSEQAIGAGDSAVMATTGSHTHDIAGNTGDVTAGANDWTPKYLNLILCSKD